MSSKTHPSLGSDIFVYEEKTMTNLTLREEIS